MEIRVIRVIRVPLLTRLRAPTPTSAGRTRSGPTRPRPTSTIIISRTRGGSPPGQFPENPFQGPGYPALLALVGGLTGDYFVAGKWISIVSAAGVVLARLFALRAPLRAVGGRRGHCVVAVSGEFPQFALNATTDAFFLLLCLAVLSPARRAPRRGVARGARRRARRARLPDPLQRGLPRRHRAAWDSRARFVREAAQGAAQAGGALSRRSFWPRSRRGSWLITGTAARPSTTPTT